MPTYLTQWIAEALREIVSQTGQSVAGWMDVVLAGGAISAIGDLARLDSTRLFEVMHSDA